MPWSSIQPRWPVLSHCLRFFICSCFTWLAHWPSTKLPFCYLLWHVGIVHWNSAVQVPATTKGKLHIWNNSQSPWKLQITYIKINFTSLVSNYIYGSQFSCMEVLNNIYRGQFGCLVALNYIHKWSYHLKVPIHTQKSIWRFWPVSLLYLFHQFICGELSFDHQDQLLDDVFSTVHIQQTSYNNW